ncbi:UNVERIFIED_CONTAM: hypothetical protein FKN15_075560 [Acipenser sinensis]
MSALDHMEKHLDGQLQEVETFMTQLAALARVPLGRAKSYTKNNSGGAGDPTLTPRVAVMAGRSDVTAEEGGTTTKRVVLQKKTSLTEYDLNHEATLEFQRIKMSALDHMEKHLDGQLQEVETFMTQLAALARVPLGRAKSYTKNNSEYKRISTMEKTTDPKPAKFRLSP